MAPCEANERLLNRPFHHPTDEALDALSVEVGDRLPIEHFGGVKLLLAVSGGADSVAMLHLLMKIWSQRSQQSPQWSPKYLAVAHFNHGLRGEDSDGDEAFVEQLCRSLSLECYSERASSQTSSAGMDRDEESLRRLRYGFLQRTAERIGARYVMVAHHRDDNLETFLHHLFRGSGLQGLSGMRQHRPLGSDVVLYRPLLQLPQAKLRSWLTDRTLAWREDASNQATNYQRNWIRQSLMPQVLQRYPGAADALERTIDQQFAILQTMQPLADRWIEDHVSFETKAIAIKCGSLDLSLLGLIVKQLWDRQAWSRQSLTQSHLHQLWLLIQRDGHLENTAFHLPGKLHVSYINEHTLRIAES